uniref:DH domain-containing protein n=1 Tax=Eptatretus burgeri TaxID=7764 RepID=A0A8C4QTY1_EPTBU
MLDVLTTYLKSHGIKIHDLRHSSSSLTRGSSLGPAERLSSFLDRDRIKIPFWKKTKRSLEKEPVKEKQKGLFKELRKHGKVIKLEQDSGATGDGHKTDLESKTISSVPISPVVKSGSVHCIIQHFESCKGESVDEIKGTAQLKRAVSIQRSESLQERQRLRPDASVETDAPRPCSASSSSASSLSAGSSELASLSFDPLTSPTPFPHSPGQPTTLTSSHSVSPSEWPEGEGECENEGGDDAGAEIEDWRAGLPPEQLRSLKPRELKRRDVIHELLQSEKRHVSSLRVLSCVFRKPLLSSSTMTELEPTVFFPNLPELIAVHERFARALRRAWTMENGQSWNDKETAHGLPATLLNQFSPNTHDGMEFMELAVQFCTDMAHFPVQLKNLQKTSKEFNSIIQEAESSPQCKRLRLQDFLPMEMQRLTKYPLLLDNITKYTPGDAGCEALRSATSSCRDLLVRVNGTVKEVQNETRLNELISHLDLSSLEKDTMGLDENSLSRLKKLHPNSSERMLHEGSLCWRLGREKPIGTTEFFNCYFLLLLLFL